MKLLALGATGGTGQQIVMQALQLGHKITVFVRDPDKLTINKHRLRVITGSFTEASGRLAEAMRGQDAVISALGVGNSLRSADLKNRSMPTIVAAMESQVVRRLIVISA